MPTPSSSLPTSNQQQSKNEQGKKLNMVTPQVLSQKQQQQHQKPVSQVMNKPVQQTNANQSASSMGTFSSSTSSNIEKVANVGVVNPVINSSNVQVNTSAKMLVDQSIVGVGSTTATNTPNPTLITTTNKIENLTHSLNNPGPAVPMQQQQQNMLPHVMDNTKKMNQDQFIDKQQKQTGHQQQNYQMQQQMNHLNIQKQQQQQPQQKSYESNMLMQREHQQQQQNMNNHHYQQQQPPPQQHHQLNVNSNLVAMKDSNSSQNISGASSSGNNNQLLNISPQNITKNNNQPPPANNVQLNQQQLMGHQNNTNNNNNSLNSNQNSINNIAAVAAAAAASNKQSAMPPPPGVNMVNPPNSQFLMSLPFVCYDVTFKKNFFHYYFLNLIFKIKF